MTETETLGIAGSGLVACGLARAAAPHLGPPTVWARSRSSAERACSVLRAEGLVTTSLGDLGACTIVVEAVIEELAAKVRVLEQLDVALGGDALLLTTTSSLSIRDLATASGRPDRFAGLHVFTPVDRNPLVEVVFPPAASETTRTRALALCEVLQKTAVVVPDVPGFIVNRLLFPFLFDAVRILDIEGVSPEIVDTCVKLGAAHPMGPLTLLDFVGLDVAAAIGAQIGAPAPERLQRLVDEGRVGRKAGAGFHSYFSC